MNFGLNCVASVLILAVCGCGQPLSRPNPNLTAREFVDSLNKIDVVAKWGGGNSRVVRGIDETVRGSVPGEDQWFVIYDDKLGRHRAVSLDYLRTISYYKKMGEEGLGAVLQAKWKGTNLGEKFRRLDGGRLDPAKVEFVSFNDETNLYVGLTSGWEYEDGAETTDVALMAGEREEIAFFTRASRISFAFSVDVKTALSLVALGKEVERMLESQGELTEGDQRALTAAFENLAGVTYEEVVEAAADGEKRKALISRIAENIGTTAENLETRLLPELFGLNF